MNAGLRPGDVIMAVDGAPVRDASALMRAISAARGRHRSTALFTVFRSPYRGSVEVEI
jgi:S1-C subfamily serine protease